MKVVINKCWGGFGLSDEAYLWMHKHGNIPIKKYTEEKRGKDGKYKHEPKNEGMVIFDRTLSAATLKTVSREDEIKFLGRYWETWSRDNEFRSNPLLVKCVEALGEKANGQHASLKVVEIPDGVKWHIEEYDGQESIDEDHRSWG
jgi:hypothetical protein